MPVAGSNGEMETLEAFYPRVSLTALVNLLRQSQEIRYAVTATHHICSHFDKALLEVYLGPIMVGYMDAIRRQDIDDKLDMRELLFEKLAELVRMSGGGPVLRRLVPLLVVLLDSFWTRHHRKCLEEILALEEVLAVSEFNFHAGSLFGLLLRTAKADRSRDRGSTFRVLEALHKMALRDYDDNVVVPAAQLRLLLPDLMRCAELRPLTCHRVRVKALAIARVCIDKASAAELPGFASVLILPLLRVISHASRLNAREDGTAGDAEKLVSFGAAGGAAGWPTSAGKVESGSERERALMRELETRGEGAPLDKELVELRSEALKTLAKGARRLGPAFRPLVRVARQQLVSMRRLVSYEQVLLAREAKGSLLGGLGAPSQAVQAALALAPSSDKLALEGYDHAALAVWAGAHAFERFERVEVRDKVQPHVWRRGEVTSVHALQQTYDVTVGGLGHEQNVDRVRLRTPLPFDKAEAAGALQAAAAASDNSGAGGSGAGGGGGGAGGGAFGTQPRSKSKAAANGGKAQKTAAWTPISAEWQHGAFRKACHCENLTTAGDWVEWLRRVSIELLRHSPCPYIQPCAAIAEVHEPLAYELFNAAFISVWNGLYFDEEDRDLALDDIPVVVALENALQVSCPTGH